MGQQKENMPDNDPLVAAVQAHFFEDEGFGASFEKWAADHCQEIDNDSDEMKLIYRELYENKMQEFLSSQGSSVEEFHQKIKEADRNGADAQFIDMMLMILDFDSFMQMMREAK